MKTKSSLNLESVFADVAESFLCAHSSGFTQRKPKKVTRHISLLLQKKYTISRDQIELFKSIVGVILIYRSLEIRSNRPVKVVALWEQKVSHAFYSRLRYLRDEEMLEYIMSELGLNGVCAPYNPLKDIFDVYCIHLFNEGFIEDTSSLKKKFGGLLVHPNLSDLQHVLLVRLRQYGHRVRL